MTIHNDTAAEIPFTMDAHGPARLDRGGQALRPGAGDERHRRAQRTGTMTVTATPASDVTAGDYPLQASVTGGGKTASIDLGVSITGTYTLTPVDARPGAVDDGQRGLREGLPAHASPTTGTAPITNVAMSASAPTSWKVEFEPATIPSVDAGRDRRT